MTLAPEATVPERDVRTIEETEAILAEMARARDAALDASRAKSAFLAHVSHELRTPLHAILGFAELLQEDAADAGHDRFLPDLSKITGTAQHLVGLISNVLDLSKIEAGKMELFLEDFDLSQVISDVVTTLMPLTTQNNNALEVSLSDDLGTIHADSTRVRQVLFNLLSNATRFTEQGTIVLGAERIDTPGGEFICMTITDTGIGIAPHHKEKLFQSFTQADDSTTRKYGGTGLGLAISQRFCQMMGGTISVQSELGKGSTFTVQLPAHVVPVEVSGPEARTEEAPAVLVISEDEQVRESMAKFLAREGLRIVTAQDAERSVTMARLVRPAAIILDVSSPDLTGWSVLTALKAEPATADVPMITSTREDSSDQGCPLGASDYLTRPIDGSRLSRLMSRFEGQRSTPRVLLIDDESDNRTLLARAAEQNGWEVIEASSGWQGLRSVVEAPPDLILLDLLMPEMDGFEFLRLVRTSQAGQSIPVVVVTDKELTTEDRLRLSRSVHKILQKSALDRQGLFAEIEALVTAHVSQRQASVAAPTQEASQPPAAESAEIAELRRRLERAEAERDEALEQLQGADDSIGEIHLPSLSVEMGLELERTKKMLREQRQTIELLAAESEKGKALASDLEQARTELKRLRDERDVALTKARQAEPPEELALGLRRLEQEVEALRQREPERRRSRKVAAVKPEAAPVKAPALDAGPGACYVKFQDSFGRTHSIQGTTADLRTWFAKGMLEPIKIQVSRSPEGPFLPMICIEDLRDVVRDFVTEPVWTPLSPAGRAAPDAPPPFSLPEPEPEPPATEAVDSPASARRSEWITWSILTLMALIAALVVGHQMFW